MRIPALTEAYSTEIRKTEARRTEKPSDKARVAQADRSEFSADARRLSETRAQSDIVSTQLANQPDIRPEKISEVQDRIASGYYNSPELMDKLATKLMSEFGLGGTGA